MDEGFDVDFRSEKTCSSAMHIALMKGHVDIAKELVARGATVTFKNENGDTPLHLAANLKYVHGDDKCNVYISIMVAREGGFKSK